MFQVSKSSGSAKKSAFSNNHTLIAQGTHIKGDLVFEGELQIEGRVHGNIVARVSEPGQISSVVIAETGEVSGNIYAPRVVINGKVDGDVFAPALAELAKKAQFQGLLHYQDLHVVQGASINARLIREAADLIPKTPEEYREQSDKAVGLAAEALL